MNKNLQVGVKVFLKNKEGKFLLVKRSFKKYPDVKGVWDIVGGRIEVGTTLMENLRREVFEETKLKIISEPKLISAQDIISNSEKHIVRISYVADTDGDPVLDMEENTEYRWLSIEEIKSMPDIDIYVKEIVENNF